MEKVKKEKQQKKNGDKNRNPNEAKQIENRVEDDEYEDKEIKKKYWS